jgi:epoxyqueuosine reductase
VVNVRERYQQVLVGPIERFDQRNDIFRRAKYDPKVIRWRARFDGATPVQNKPGYTQADYALTGAAWHLEDHYAKGHMGTNHDGLYAWTPPNPDSVPSEKLEATNPAVNARLIKRAARFFGADLVGICELNRLWVYSHVTNDVTGEHAPVEIPAECRYAIAIAIEMAYGYVQTSPSGGASAATGLAYSKMAFVAGLLAQFIRGLGYKAIPCGNDTALSIPIAVEAGLGELGRNGLLVTQKLGPRVRLCKVFTDLPLAPDEPTFFGLEEFCRICIKCAHDCPSRAIPFGEKTTQAPTISNNPGVLKWVINPEQCFKWWGANGADCSNCIRVCPFNQETGLQHDLVRGVIKRTPRFNRLFLWLDGVFGYGRQFHPTSVWDD